MIPLENVDVYHLVASHLFSEVLKEVNDNDYGHFLFLFFTTQFTYVLWLFVNYQSGQWTECVCMRIYIYRHVKACIRDAHVRQKKRTKED